MFLVHFNGQSCVPRADLPTGRYDRRLFVPVILGGEGVVGEGLQYSTDKVMATPVVLPLAGKCENKGRDRGTLKHPIHKGFGQASITARRELP